MEVVPERDEVGEDGRDFGRGDVGLIRGAGLAGLADLADFAAFTFFRAAAAFTAVLAFFSAFTVFSTFSAFSAFSAFFDVIFLVAMARSSGMGESFESMPRVRRPASGVPPTDFRKMRNS